MSSSSSHDSMATSTARNHSLISCSKTTQLSSGAGTTAAAVVLGHSPASVALPTGNVHCSIGQQSGSSGAGLGPIMEIREMNTYCNSCVTVGADKYWNHHSHDNVSRLTAAVYPQMFYTPPPPSIPTAGAAPPPGSYSTASGSGVPTAPSANDWTCPPSTADSYSHFIYSQYPPPPPPPSQHHDYSNFLGISTSCYEPDMMLMSGVTGVTTSQQGPNNCDVPTPAATQAMMNSFMYPAPLPPSLASFESVMTLPPVTVTSLQPSRSVIKSNSPFSSPVPPVPPTSPPSSASSSSSGDSTDETDEEDDDESRHIISIEDDENDNIIDDEDLNSSSVTEESISTAVATSLCVLCRKPAQLLPVLAPNAPSPQLSRILDNIDDDELDISVCSGDIEIGGIEDEMIQHASEQHQQSISFRRLSKLLGVPTIDLLPSEEDKGGEDKIFHNTEQVASLCIKCQKLVAIAESLEKQLSSVLISLRQVFSLEDCIFPKISCASVTSIGTQTENYDVDHQKNGSILVRRCNVATSGNSSSCNNVSNNHSSTCRNLPSTTTAIKTPVETANDCLSLMTLCQYLCHECGQKFNCRRNLGKHIKRHHNYLSSTSSIPAKRSGLPTCPRENCGKAFFDNAALRVHLRKHTSEKPYFCVDCLKLFTTKSNLTAHIKSNVCRGKVPDIAEKLPQPSIQFSMNSPSPLNSPRENDSVDNSDVTTGNANSGDNSKFHCENCGLTFRTESRFQKHINNTKSTCSKSKLFQCDLCPQLFAKRSELQTHQAVHTRQKSFQCDICGVAFSTRGNQRVHQRGHFNQKRFKCQHCDKGFTRNQTLQTHITNVHK